jgi:cold shock CspA family protein
MISKVNKADATKLTRNENINYSIDADSGGGQARALPCDETRKGPAAAPLAC